MYAVLCRSFAARGFRDRRGLLLLLLAHHLVRLYLFAETFHLLQRGFFFFQVLAEKLRNLSVLHLASHIDQRLVLADFVALRFDRCADIEDIDEILGRIFFGERLLFGDQTADAVAFGLLWFFAQQLEGLSKPFNLAFGFSAVLLKCLLQLCA